MKINEQWSVEEGNECFVVSENRKGRNPKTGEEVTTVNRTYHPTLEQCARKIVRSQTLSALTEDDLSRALASIEHATSRLTLALESERAA